MLPPSRNASNSFVKSSCSDLDNASKGQSNKALTHVKLYSGHRVKEKAPSSSVPRWNRPSRSTHITQPQRVAVRCQCPVEIRLKLGQLAHVISQTHRKISSVCLGETNKQTMRAREIVSTRGNVIKQSIILLSTCPTAMNE